MKRFAEDTKEYSKDNEWWERIPLLREHDDKKPPKVSKSEKKFLTSEEQKAIKLKKEKKKKRKDKIKGIEHGLFFLFKFLKFLRFLAHQLSPVLILIFFGKNAWLGNVESNNAL